MNRMIAITGAIAEGAEWRGAKETLTKVVEVSTETLAKEAVAFVEGIGRIVEALDLQRGKVTLDTVEVRAGLTLNSKFSLLGLGSGLEADSAITLTFSIASGRGAPGTA